MNERKKLKSQPTDQAIGDSSADNNISDLSTEFANDILRRFERLLLSAESKEAVAGQKYGDQSSGFMLGAPRPGRRFEDNLKEYSRQVAPSLPSSRVVRAILRNRRLRDRFFDHNLFADPAWDILLDLTAAEVEGTSISVHSLCIASGVPPTTALRWIKIMGDYGLLHRREDTMDQRRSFIELTEKSRAAIARYFAAASSLDSAVL